VTAQLPDISDTLSLIQKVPTYAMLVLQGYHNISALTGSNISHSWMLSFSNTCNIVLNH
jgi:hypothetical protein